MIEHDIPRQMFATHRCVVYETRSGKVVHIHDFISDDGCVAEPEVLHEAALDQAPQYRTSGYAVADVPSDMIANVATYRVDPQTRQVCTREGGDRQVFRQPNPSGKC